MERRDKVNPMIDGDEYDILTPYRKNYKIGAGVAKEVKRKYNKRTRQKVEDQIRRELDTIDEKTKEINENERHNY